MRPLNDTAPTRIRCPSGLIAAVLIGVQAICVRGLCDADPAVPVLAVVTTPVGRGREAEIARSLIPGDFPTRYELRPIGELVSPSPPAGQSETLERAKEITRRAKEASLAFDLVLAGTSGRLISVRNGVYDNVPIDVVTGRKKMVDVPKYYNVERLRPRYRFINRPIFIMTSDV